MVVGGEEFINPTIGKIGHMALGLLFLIRTLWYDYVLEKGKKLDICKESQAQNSEEGEQQECVMSISKFLSTIVEGKDPLASKTGKDECLRFQANRAWNCLIYGITRFLEEQTGWGQRDLSELFLLKGPSDAFLSRVGKEHLERAKDVFSDLDKMLENIRNDFTLEEREGIWEQNRFTSHLFMTIKRIRKDRQKEEDDVLSRQFPKRIALVFDIALFFTEFLGIRIDQRINFAKGLVEVLINTERELLKSAIKSAEQKGNQEQEGS